MRKHQQGAALLAVVVVALILSILLTAAHALMEQRLSIASKAQQQLNEKAAAHGKLNELTYLIATQRVTRAGISQGTNHSALTRDNGMWLSLFTGDELRVDGFTYQEVVNGVTLSYSIQSQNGLIPVNASSQLWLKNWLKGYGISDYETTVLANSLHDYADADDWALPAGAEQYTYNKEDLSPPSNFLLQTCGELFLVINWPAVLEKHPSILNECSLSRTGGLNLNAIPLTLWKVLWPNTAEKVAQQRSNNIWLINRNDALNVVPELLALDEAYYAFFPNAHFHLTVNTAFTTQQLAIQRNKGQLPPTITRFRPVH